MKGFNGKQGLTCALGYCRLVGNGREAVECRFDII